MAVGKGRPRQQSKGGWGWHGCGGGRGLRRPFCLGLRPLATWPGCHFVARPPFRAARGAGRWGRDAPCSRGAGLATAPGLPPQKRKPARPLCSSPPGSRLGARALPRRSAGCACARARARPCEPPKSRREACARRAIFPALRAFPEWDSPPHPRCVKGMHFRRQCSALHRGKLEFHPEKDGASRSLVLVRGADPFACPALNHNGASAQRSDIAQRRRWENQQRC